MGALIRSATKSKGLGAWIVDSSSGCLGSKGNDQAKGKEPRAWSHRDNRLGARQHCRISQIQTKIERGETNGKMAQVLPHYKLKH
jgi:hypothetical protein